MELTESIKSINSQLIALYGIDTSSNQPMWRNVWSDDQFENRYDTFTDYTESGLYIRTVTERRLVPKYNYIKARYVLERLVLVPEGNRDELLGIKTSYEPIWTWENSKGPLPPKLELCKFMIDMILAVQHGTKMKRYIDPEGTTEGFLIEKQKRIEQLMEELYGDESSLMLTTVTGESVAYTGPSLIESEKK